MEDRKEIIRQAGVYFASALTMPVGLLDISDVCVYGPPDIINNTFLEAAQQELDRTTVSAFHGHTTIRRCQCGADITLRGAAIIAMIVALAGSVLGTALMFFLTFLGSSFSASCWNLFLYTVLWLIPGLLTALLAGRA